MTDARALAADRHLDRAALARSTQPSVAELLIVFAAVCVGMFGVFQGIDVGMTLNFVAPTILTIGLGLGVVQMVMKDRAAVWTPLIWWRLTMLTYSGLGSLTPYFASEATFEYIRNFFDTYPEDITKYNLVCSLFSLILLLMARLVPSMISWRRGSPTQSSAIVPCAFNKKQVGFAALLIGAPIKFFVTILPMLTGNPTTILGSIGSLETVMSIGYALLIAYYLDQRSSKVWLIFALVMADAALGVMSFNKQLAFFPIIMACLGVIYQRPTLSRTAAAAAVTLSLYAAAGPLVSYGRYADWGAVGARQPTFERSAAILSDYANGDRVPEYGESIDAGWARISYFPAGSFAIHQYDIGIPGDSLRDLDVVLIPRFLWPDKPIITSIGSEFNFAATGNEDSSANPGIPAEGYWVFGWLGVTLMAVTMGIVFSLWSIYGLTVLNVGAWHLLVPILLGIRCGGRIDGTFTVDFVPATALAILTHLVLSFANTLALRNARAPVASARIA